MPAFPGDAVPSPDLGGSTSETKVLTVSADGTGLTVPDVSGTYGQPVTLSAQLTSSAGSGVGGKSITFSLNGVSFVPVTTGSDGWAYLSNVSTAGISAGPHPDYRRQLRGELDIRSNRCEGQTDSVDIIGGEPVNGAGLHGHFASPTASPILPASHAAFPGPADERRQLSGRPRSLIPTTRVSLLCVHDHASAVDG